MSASLHIGRERCSQKNSPGELGLSGIEVGAGEAVPPMGKIVVIMAPFVN